jgi:hypothetical protein
VTCPLSGIWDVTLAMNSKSQLQEMQGNKKEDGIDRRLAAEVDKSEVRPALTASAYRIISQHNR